MKRCHLPQWLAVLALPLLALPSLATTVIAPDFGKLVGSADYVVRATVTSVTSEWRDTPGHPGSKYIASLVALDVHEVLKGTPPSPLILDVVGGTVGDVHLDIEGAPQFEVGQEAILFVQGNGRQVVPLVGMDHGFYRVRRDKRTGEAQVLRHNGLLLFNDDAAVGTPADTAAATHDASAKPLTPEQFAGRVRSTAKETEEARRERLK